MLKVMIVDKDEQMCETFNNMKVWKEENFEIIAVTKKRIEILDYVEEYQPEVVLFDVAKNPVSMIKEIKDYFKETMVIGLGVDTSVNFVRSVMKAGAFDYLLKDTLTERELRAVLKQIKMEMYNLKEAKKKKRDEEGRFLQYLTMFREKQNVDVNEFLEQINNRTFDYLKRSYQIAYVRIDNINQVHKENKVNREKMRRTMMNVFRRVIPSYIKSHVYFMKSHSATIIFESNDDNEIQTIAYRIIYGIKEELALDSSISLSKVIYGMKDFQPEYQHMMEIHELRFYLGGNSVIKTHEISSFHHLNYDAINYHTIIINKVKERDFHTARDVMNDALQYIRENHIYPKEVKSYFIFILNNIEGNEMVKGIRNVTSFEDLKEDIIFSETLTKLTEVCNLMITRIEQWLQDRANSKYRREIQEIVDYIEQNLDKKISLHMIAGDVNLNESYLSRTFKQQTGKNLINFINEKKMDRAVELLQDPNIMIKEVAFQVGMEDQFYFNKVFKKFYGVSPSEFRKKCWVKY